MLLIRVPKGVKFWIELLLTLHSSAHLATPGRLLDTDSASNLLGRHLSLEQSRAFLTQIYYSRVGQRIFLRGILNQLRNTTTMRLAHRRRWTKALQLSKDHLLAWHIAHLCQLFYSRPPGCVQLLLTLIHLEQPTSIQLVQVRFLNS